MKLYLVSNGEFDEYHVVGLYTTEEKIKDGV